MKREKKLRYTHRRRRRSPPWIDLPEDLTANILHRLGPVEILTTAEKVCKTWRRVCREPSLWRVIDYKKPPDFWGIRELEFLFCIAIDRSRGQLIDINIECYGTDVLLRYISDRGRHLKRMRIVGCDISKQTLINAVEKFPLLEELHLIEMSFISCVDIETMSVSCPLLKSFSYCSVWYTYPPMGIDDSHALSIAKSMPGLSHLSLVGNLLSNVGVEAILKGCPKLESLDLRVCFHVDLECDFGKRCLEQIKEVRLPMDSTADCTWKTALYDKKDYLLCEYDTYTMSKSDIKYGIPTVLKYLYVSDSDSDSFYDSE